jgi:hypothetical protein
MNRFVSYQARTFAGLWFWIRRRRQGVGQDDIALGYARERLPMLIVLAGVLAVESAVVGLLVPWPIVHVLDVLSLLQVLGIAATMVTRPHYVSRDALVLREGPRFELRIPLGAIASARRVRTDHNGPTFELTGQTLSIVIGNQTDVVVTLTEPMTVTLPNGTTGEVEELRLRADDPVAAVSGIQARLSAGEVARAGHQRGQTGRHEADHRAHDDHRGHTESVDRRRDQRQSERGEAVGDQEVQ